MCRGHPAARTSDFLLLHGYAEGPVESRCSRQSSMLVRFGLQIDPTLPRVRAPGETTNTEANRM
jgi:hypothetical protein